MQFRQRSLLDLSHAFLGQPEQLSEFIECMRTIIRDIERACVLHIPDLFIALHLND